MTERRPFQAAWQSRDATLLAGALADDVVAHSPLLKAPFRGRATVASLYEVLFRVFGELRFTDEFASSDRLALFWRADLDGRWVEGADLLRFDDRGMISEISVLIRPLVDLGWFGVATAGPYARTKGRFRGWVARVFARTLQAILAVTDATATRLVK